MTQMPGQGQSPAFLTLHESSLALHKKGKKLLLCFVKSQSIAVLFVLADPPICAISATW